MAARTPSPDKINPVEDRSRLGTATAHLPECKPRKSDNNDARRDNSESLENVTGGLASPATAIYSVDSARYEADRE